MPELRGYVNDYAAMMSPDARGRLEQELRAFEQSDSTQIVVLTIPSLGGEVLEEYSIKVAEAWKIGHRGKDNGIIVLAAKQERKIRIEVGRGLEGRVTDLTAGRIIDLVIKPRFKRGDFDGGFIAGASALMDAAKGEFTAVEDRRTASRPLRSLAPFFTFLIFGGIVLIFLGSFSRALGGAAGAVGLPALVAATLVRPGLVGLIVLGLIGFGAGMFIPGLFSSGSRSRGRGSGHLLGASGSGSGWSTFSGGGFGGGSDGGGFSGGGGDFGGGGASGDW